MSFVHSAFDSRGSYARVHGIVQLCQCNETMIDVKVRMLNDKIQLRTICPRRSIIIATVPFEMLCAACFLSRNFLSALVWHDGHIIVPQFIVNYSALLELDGMVDVALCTEHKRGSNRFIRRLGVGAVSHDFRDE